MSMTPFETMKEDILYSVKRYYMRPGKREEWVDLVWHYLMLADKDIPNYRAVWTNLVEERFPGRYCRELLEYMYGAHERYKQALFARDIIGKLVMKYPDNDVLFIVNLHVYYFITVIKALADSLALILNYFYDIGLESSPDKIDITKEPFSGNFFADIDFFRSEILTEKPRAIWPIASRHVRVSY